MSKHKHKHESIIIDGESVKIRKRFAPGVRVIKSDKDKERKHKRDFLDIEDELDWWRDHTEGE